MVAAGRRRDGEAAVGGAVDRRVKEEEDLPAEYGKLIDKIVSTPAQTAAGAAAQVQFYLDDLAPASGSEREMLQNVLATLRAISGT